MKKLFFLFSLTVLVSGCQGDGPHLKALLDNNRGVVHLQKEEDALALKRFIDAAVREPFDPRIQMNLGIAYELLEDFDKAYQSYSMVLETANLAPIMEFQALFNMARVEGARKNIEEALALYQRALKINPQSIETKHNIELLMLQGSGGGGGEEGDQGGEGENNQPPSNPQDQKDQDQPKPEELSPQDVKQILEELNRQEKKIRAKEMEQEGGEPKNGKNW